MPSQGFARGIGGQLPALFDCVLLVPQRRRRHVSAALHCVPFTERKTPIHQEGVFSACLSACPTPSSALQGPQLRRWRFKLHPERRNQGRSTSRPCRICFLASCHASQYGSAGLHGGRLEWPCTASPALRPSASETADCGVQMQMCLLCDWRTQSHYIYGQCKTEV
jgi:hypothetical protein